MPQMQIAPYTIWTMLVMIRFAIGSFFLSWSLTYTEIRSLQSVYGCSAVRLLGPDLVT